jgi:hypothetical protein
VAKHQRFAATGLMRDEPQEHSTPSVNSIFEQPWWLDSVAPGAWDAAVVRRGDRVVGRLPYTRRRRLGLNIISQPPLTQTLGPWLAGSEGKRAHRLEQEKKVLEQLIELLPPFDFFRQAFAPSLTNWLPFYWAGFQATVRITYRIDDLSDLDRVQSEFQEHVRRGVRKGRGAVEIDHDCPLSELLRLDAQTYARKGLPPRYPEEVVRRLDAACGARGARRILRAVDAQGRVHAALFVVWDDGTLYPVINGRDPELQAFGANTLLYWEAIRLASEVSRVFDFEGSMLKPVEHFIRGFGGRQTPYLQVSKASLAARSLLAARDVLNRRRARG